MTVFEWDEAKNQTNIRKHGVDFRDATRIFDGPVVSGIGQAGRDGEIRQITIGLLDQIVVVAVVHTERTGIVRIISARPASRKERRRYEQAVQSSLDC